MELIKLEDLTKTYHVGEMDVPVLKGVSLAIGRGELVALMGASGSGKSTLMNILGCLDRPTSGQVLARRRGSLAALVRPAGDGPQPQDRLRLPELQPAAAHQRARPGDDAADLYATHLSDQGEGRAAGEELLERVGLGERMDHEPSQLSGGQQQRVAIARALINHPPLLFADEPTGNLDSKTSKEMLQMFQQLNEEERITIILVTHDANVAAVAKRTIKISDGLIECRRVRRARFRACRRSRRRWRKWSSHEISHSHVFQTALPALRRNVMRSALTCVGIIIGIAAVIAMMEIGNGSSALNQRTIASLGANNLLIQPGAAASGGVSFGAGSI